MAMLDKVLGRREPPNVEVLPTQPVASDIHAYPIQSIRRVVPVGHKSPPRPVPYSAFEGVGRDPGHDRARVDQVHSLAFSEWLGVMGWPFAIPHVSHALVVGMTGGRQTPIRHRVNIETPTPTPVGDRMSVKAPGTTDTYVTPLGGVPSPLAKIG